MRAKNSPQSSRAVRALRLTLGLAAVLLVSSQATAAPPDFLTLRPCPSTGACKWFPHRMVIQGNALGRTATIVPAVRGVAWPDATGRVTLAIPRPLDYGGGPVRVVVFHYVNGSEDGTVGFRMTPVNLVPGGGYETYGSVSTPLANAAHDTHYEQSVVLAPPGGGFSGYGAWWHVEIARYGTYPDNLLLQTVLVEYD